MTSLIDSIIDIIETEFNTPILDPSKINIQPTRKEFEGDITLVTFPLSRLTKLSPEETANRIGTALQNKLRYVQSFNIVKGFLNISFTTQYWIEVLNEILHTPNYGVIPKGEHTKNIMIEYSSPNTNKPLHLGHVRNNLLGWSVAEILKANGHNVHKVQIINDRGIHICKSMVAWKLFGNGETPSNSNLKGDKLVGKYYVLFNEQFVKEQSELSELSDNVPIMLEAREMLLKWEAGNKEVHDLWATMNEWVYDGFDKTYERLGVDFDKLYYESDTYLTGKEVVEKGVSDGHFKSHEDGSIWCDLTGESLDNKLLLRSDGTSVYMTQDIGTAIMRYNDWSELDQLIYTVGNEQDHHFKVLFSILKKLGYTWAEACYHLSYGMVDLPNGRMKSREGTVVDADDLMEEMYQIAKKQSEEKGKGGDDELHEMIGLGALKYFILRVDPRKRMVFDPEESIDLQGNTGPFIQYTHARIYSLLNKAVIIPTELSGVDLMDSNERIILHAINQYPEVVKQAGMEYNPSLIANYVYGLAKDFNHFYQETPILKEENIERCHFRIILASMTGQIISSAMSLLGIGVPEKM